MTDPDEPPPPGRVRALAGLVIKNLQARLATALGVSRARRTETVGAMLESNARRAPGYWLQLFLATGIAMLGLALGSTAVVIGGMLVSPLMGPIVELGMGFAVGSSLLVIRAFLRVLLSGAVVIVAAALMTLALPFHEVTSEIAARTAPTLLDLLVAIFCALAAAYTTVRQTADTTAAAAGTAIGIALVPPLCVVGYGFGTASMAIASGAGLLFTANFSGIVVVAVLSFLLLGYNQVQADALEHDYLESGTTRTDRMAARAHARLRSVFGSRYGLAARLVVPAVVLAAVAVPLNRALDEVAWGVRARDAVRRILAEESPAAVQSALTVERRAVTVRLLVVGSPQQAAGLEQRLGLRIASVAGVTPVVSVTAVPDAEVLQATLASEARPAPVVPSLDLRETERQLGSALSAAWPTPAAGPLLGWELEVVPRQIPRLIVRHLGPPLGAAAEEMLSRAVAASTRSPVRVADVAFPANPVVAEPRGDSAWVAGALALLEEVVRVDSAVACVTQPAGGGRRSAAVTRTASAALIEPLLRGSAAGRAGRLVLSAGPAWTIRVAPAKCVTPD
jgi:uncharacterized hydrophobic protein (TIGR00271 family)